PADIPNDRLGDPGDEEIQQQQEPDLDGHQHHGRHLEIPLVWPRGAAGDAVFDHAPYPLREKDSLTLPSSRRSPSDRFAVWTRSPFSLTPFVDPRSAIVQRPPWPLTSAWRRLTDGSSRVMSQSGRRPMTIFSVSEAGCPWPSA